MVLLHTNQLYEVGMVQCSKYGDHDYNRRMGAVETADTNTRKPNRDHLPYLLAIYLYPEPTAETIRR